MPNWCGTSFAGGLTSVLAAQCASTDNRDEPLFTGIPRPYGHAAGTSWAGPAGDPFGVNQWQEGQ